MTEIKKFFLNKKNWLVIGCVLIMVLILLSTCAGNKKYEKSTTEINAEKVAFKMDSLNKLLVKDSIRRNEEIIALDNENEKKDATIRKLKRDLSTNIGKVQKYKQSEITKDLNKIFNVNTIVAIDSSQIKIPNDVGKTIIVNKLEQESCNNQLIQEKQKNDNMVLSAKIKDSTHNDLKQQFRNVEIKSEEKDRVNSENKDRIVKLEKSVNKESNRKSFWKTTTGIVIIAIISISIFK